jgi:hypothetical protein
LDEVACTIRRAVPADAAALADLAARTFRDTFEADNTREDMSVFQTSGASSVARLDQSAVAG